jgi:HD superfamily phosphohydrolase
MDDGTAVELGMSHRSGAVILGYKERQEDPILRHGLSRPLEKIVQTPEGPITEHMHVDEKGYFVEENTDRNIMPVSSLSVSPFYGPREQALEEIAAYIKTNVKGWYRHEDPLLGRKLLPPTAIEVFETITPNYEVDMTRWRTIIEHPMMRRLREIKQLGAMFWKYPDATHTRYAHSVMTYKLTHDMLRHLRLSEEEKRHVLVYALLHDIGHTPYSHELEEIADLDQMEAAKQILKEETFHKALKECDINLETLLTFFDKKNPLRAIVSDKVLGTDKLAYLLRDGIATGKGGYDNIDLLIEHTIYEDGVLGIDERAADSAFKQILLYHTTYASTYFSPDTRLSQRIFTLLGQIGMETGALPPDWPTRNDLWYDHYNITAEQSGNEALKKLGAEGIVKDNYVCVASMRLKGAELLEESGIKVSNITEEEYTKFLTVIPVRERKKLEELLCEEAGVKPLDLLIAPGGRLNKLKIDDTWVFRKDGKKVRLLEDMDPDFKQSLENRARRQAISLRIYARKECTEKVNSKLTAVIEKLREIMAA